MLLRFAAAEQRRVDADEAPGADVATPAARAVVALPAGHAFGIDGLVEADGQRRLADIVVAGDRHPRGGQAILLRPGESDVILVAGAVEGDIAAVDDEIGRLAPHLVDENVPVVDEVSALAADVRVGDLDDADRGLRPTRGVRHGVTRSTRQRRPRTSEEPETGSHGPS